MKNTVSKIHRFSYGHKLTGHQGACKNYHGHNAKVVLTVERDDLDNNGMVIDFGIIKKTLCKWIDDHWDHKFLIKDGDPSAIHDEMTRVDFNPTAENMARYLLEYVGPLLLSEYNVRLTRVRFYENDDNYAEVSC